MTADDYKNWCKSEVNYIPRLLTGGIFKLDGTTVFPSHGESMDEMCREYCFGTMSQDDFMTLFIDAAESDFSSIPSIHSKLNTDDLKALFYFLYCDAKASCLDFLCQVMHFDIFYPDDAAHVTIHTVALTPYIRFKRYLGRSTGNVDAEIHVFMDHNLSQYPGFPDSLLNHLNALNTHRVTRNKGRRRGRI